MVAKPKFEAIGDILSPESAFVQASMALDVAGYIAQRTEDVEGLTTVAALYISLADKLMTGPEGEELEEVKEPADKQPLGFSPRVVPEVQPVEVEREDDE